MSFDLGEFVILFRVRFWLFDSYLSQIHGKSTHITAVKPSMFVMDTPYCIIPPQPLCEWLMYSHTQKICRFLNCEARWANCALPNQASFVLEWRNHILMNILPNKLNCNISVFCFPPVFPASHPHSYLKAAHLILLKIFSYNSIGSILRVCCIECICYRVYYL